MGRTDFPVPGHDTFPAVSSDFAPGPAHTGHAESATAPHAHGDLSESFSPNWESAWIDLGGEG